MGIWYQQSFRNGTQGPRTLGPSLSSLFPGSSLMTNTPVPQAPNSQWSGHLQKSSLSVATAASQMCGHLVSIILAPHPHNLGLCTSCFICPIAGMVKASQWESTDSLLYLFLGYFWNGGKNKNEKRILMTAAVRSRDGGVRRLEYESLEGRDHVFFQHYAYSHI